jgi:hypothetical protein
VSDYARSMPALGFDPAPGDDGLTRGLAKTHASVVQELQQVLALVKGIDLTSWQGDAGAATRTLIGTFPPALQQTITNAQQLQSAAGSWTSQLSGFQSEADALERQAASASPAPGAPSSTPAPSPGPTPSPSPGPAPVAPGGSGASGSTLAQIQAQAHELNGRYLSAAKSTADPVDEDPGLWEKSEPIRKVLEAVLAPLDIVAADHWIDLLKEAAGVPAEWLSELDEQIEGIESLQAEGKSAVEALIEAAKVADRVTVDADAWEAFAPSWLKLAAGSLSEIRGLSYGLGALGVLADLGTVISPQDSGALGWVDRGAAGVNGALLIANMATDEIPVVGEVTLVATGLYLAGDFLYHHWTPFRDVSNDVGHATVTAVKWTGHAAVTAAKATGHAVSSAYHSVTSTIGSWF